MFIKTNLFAFEFIKAFIINIIELQAIIYLKINKFLLKIYFKKSKNNFISKSKFL